MNSKSYILAASLIMALFNPSYCSLVRRLSTSSKASRQLLAVSFNNKLCVDYATGGWDWLTPYSGEYTHNDEIINGKPSYTMSKCGDSQNCKNGMTLSIGTDDRWYFNGQPSGTIRDPFCENSGANSPNNCIKWWGGRNPIISVCGNIQTDQNATPAPTTTTLAPAPSTNSLTASQKQFIVDQHNKYRGNVARGEVKGANGNNLPKAAKMSAVVWNDNLASGSQNWASQCQQKHDTNVWESIAWSSNPIQTAVDQWFSEISIYNYGDAWSLENGHLLAIIHQDATKIGCGYANCNNGLLPGGPWLVCRYESNGEVMTAPYTTSSTTIGSACTNGVNSSLGLCL